MAKVFRLMTANLLNERCDVKDFAQALEETQPDVVVTQELGPRSAEVLAHAYPVTRLMPALDFTGRGVATRFRAEFGDIDMPGRPGSEAMIDVEGSRVHLAGIHLFNPIQFPWWVSVGTRRLQLSGLFDWLDRLEGPVVVAGDFNASPAWPAYKSITGRLSDLVSARAEREGIPVEPTWGWRPGWPRMLRIDHIFGRGLAANTVTVRRILGTDHAAVIADLELWT